MSIADRIYARLLASGTAVPVADLDRSGGDDLLTVRCDGADLVPTFQLRDGEADPLAREAVRALRDAGYGPWEVWDWAETPNTWIGRRAPADAMRDGDRDAVAVAVEAATGPGPDA